LLFLAAAVVQCLQVVVRNGRPLSEALPQYEELDYVPAAIKSGAHCCRFAFVADWVDA